MVVLNKKQQQNNKDAYRCYDEQIVQMTVMYLTRFLASLTQVKDAFILPEFL